MSNNRNLPPIWLIKTAAWLHTRAAFADMVTMAAAVALVFGGRLL